MPENKHQIDELKLENEEAKAEAGDSAQPEEENPSHLYEKDAVDFSVKVLKALADKVREHNKASSDNKVTLNQLKKVYRRGAGDCSSVEEGKTCGQIAMARVNMFLRMKIDGPGAMETHGRATITSLIDISDSWTPSEEDFAKANEDINKHELNYNLKDVSHLYLDDYKKIEVDWS